MLAAGGAFGRGCAGPKWATGSICRCGAAAATVAVRRQGALCGRRSAVLPVAWLPAAICGWAVRGEFQ